jgi:hypothetical protein
MGTGKTAWKENLANDIADDKRRETNGDSSDEGRSKKKGGRR